MPFGSDLDNLILLIKKSGDEELEQALATFLKNLNITLQNYNNFLKFLTFLHSKSQQWDVTFEQTQ